MENVKRERSNGADVLIVDEEEESKEEDLDLVMTVDEIKSDDENGAIKGKKTPAIVEVVSSDDEKLPVKKRKKQKRKGAKALFYPRTKHVPPPAQIKTLTPDGGEQTKKRGRPCKKPEMRGKYVRKPKTQTNEIPSIREASAVPVPPPVIEYTHYDDDEDDPPVIEYTPYDVMTTSTPLVTDEPRQEVIPPLVKDLVDDYVDSNVASLQKLVVVQSNYM